MLCWNKFKQLRDILINITKNKYKLNLIVNIFLWMMINNPKKFITKLNNFIVLPKMPKKLIKTCNKMELAMKYQMNHMIMMILLNKILMNKIIINNKMLFMKKLKIIKLNKMKVIRQINNLMINKKINCKQKLKHILKKRKMLLLYHLDLYQKDLMPLLKMALENSPNNYKNPKMLFLMLENYKLLPILVYKNSEIIYLII